MSLKNNIHQNSKLKSKRYGNQFNNLPNTTWMTIVENFTRDVYDEHKTTSNRSEQDIALYKEKHNIKIFGQSVPKPILTFDEAKFPDYVKDVINGYKYKEPTPIQALVWPIVLRGHNVVGVAQTGSGKTLSFILPAILHVINQAPMAKDDGPIVLVLLPTRELALQVAEVVNCFRHSAFIRHTCIYGGTNKKKQMEDLKKDPHICIATPGRLLDYIQARLINLRRVTYLVLDEADRMLDMGFEIQLNHIINQIRPDRQMLMFSATWPNSVKQLAKGYLKDHVTINIGSLQLKANNNITQHVHVCQASEKFFKLCKLISKLFSDHDCKTIVFVHRKKTATLLEGELRNKGWSVGSIHGDKRQSARERALKDFNTTKTPILIATDVAGRGLDVKDVKCVINYDVPSEATDYIHRVGRTGRVSNKGVAYTYVTPEDQEFVKPLITLLKQSQQIVPDELLLLKNNIDLETHTKSNKRKLDNKIHMKPNKRKRGNQAPMSHQKRKKRRK